MNIKLIASDMDGTLFDPYSNISQANIEAIRMAQARGIEFIICSGRDYRDARKIMETYGISCGFICLSGAAAYDDNGTHLIDIPLTSDNLRDINRILSAYDVPMDILCSPDRYSTYKETEKIKEYCYFINGRTPLPDPIPEAILTDAQKRLEGVHYIHSLSDLPADTRVYKICCNELPEETVRKMKETFLSYPDLAAASSFPTNIELTNTLAQKGHALKAYAALRGISLEDVMTLGDSDNDLSMFTPEFGCTVAMGNAMDCIKNAAAYHTGSNREDGVAQAIHTYCGTARTQTDLNKL